MFKELSEKVANIIAQSEDQIRQDWATCLKGADEPEKLKMPVKVEFVLTRPDGKEHAKVSISWKVNVPRVLEFEVEDDSKQPSLFQ